MNKYNHNIHDTTYDISSYDEINSEIIQSGIAIIIGLGFYAFTDVQWMTALGISVTTYSLVWYLESLGRGPAIIQIMLVIATLQWILGPIIAYHYGGMTDKYKMYVPEEEYMMYAVPAIVALLVGVRLIAAKVSLSSIAIYLKSGGLDNRFIYLIIIIGLAADNFVGYVPSSLLFVAYIVSQFKYIGLLYFIVAKHQYRWLFTIAIFSLSLISSAEQGLFHGLILWSALIFSYICIAVQFTRFQKLAIFFVGILLITSLQSIKADYRQLISYDVPNDEAKVSMLIDMLLGSATNLEETTDSKDIGSLNARLNQGWIISAVMNHVPSQLDFVEGETIISAFQDSLIPRFIIDKKEAIVSDNFKKYTGLSINQSTSMGISVLGEAYVNFGVFGGVIFMLLWGMLIAIMMKIIAGYSKTHPTIILWVPLIFLQMVKAETELVVVLNHGVKTSIAIALFYLTAKKIFGWRI